MSTKQDRYLEQFTRRARRVLWLALDIASASGHRLIEPEHVLVGLSLEKGSIAFAALQELNINAQLLRVLLLQRMPPQAALMEGEEVPFSDSTRQLIQLAVGLATQMGNPFVGTEHLLLAVLDQSKYGVVAMLRECGSSPEIIIRRVRKILRNAPPAPAAAPGAQDTGGFHYVIKLALREAEEAGYAEMQPEHLLIGLWLAEFSPVREVFGAQGVTEASLRGAIQQLYSHLKNANGADENRPPERSLAAQMVIQDAEQLAADNHRPVMPYDLFHTLIVDYHPLRRLLALLQIDQNKLREDLVRYGIQLSRYTLTDWLGRLVKRGKPAYPAKPGTDTGE